MKEMEVALMTKNAPSVVRYRIHPTMYCSILYFSVFTIISKALNVNILKRIMIATIVRYTSDNTCNVADKAKDMLVPVSNAKEYVVLDVMTQIINIMDVKDNFLSKCPIYIYPMPIKTQH